VGTRRYVLGKILSALATLAFVLTFNFFLFRVMPGDPAKILARNRLLPPEAIEELRKEFGIDKPLTEQFVVYVKETLTLNLGTSFQFYEPVSELIGLRIGRTVLLVGITTILSAIIGILLGIHGAWRRGSLFDLVTLSGSLILYAMPLFFLGILLLLIFGVFLGWFPFAGIETAGANYTGLARLADILNHAVLPGLTLTLGYIGEFALVMRSSLIEVMEEDYVYTARAKGLRDDMVRRKHAVPNALLPTVTLVFLHLGFVIGGAVTVEYVFSWDGLGSLTVAALRAPDLPLLQGLFLLFSVAVIVANLTADLLYAYLDPRIRRA
jgi:peptide/nickel transport system permease protein